MPIEINSKSNPSRTPWNKGRLVGQKRPLRPKEVWAIRVRLQIKHNKRDLAMFILGIDSKPRACDLVSLRVDDIAVGGHVRVRATIIQRKTGRRQNSELFHNSFLFPPSDSAAGKLPTLTGSLCAFTIAVSLATCAVFCTSAARIANTGSAELRCHDLHRCVA